MNSINKPFLLKPAYKDYLWGGNRLNEDFAKNIDVKPLAETWECSCHPDGLSIVNSGEYKGKSLKEVLDIHPEYLGKHAGSLTNGELPILIKFIDADKDLSIQVHPDDEYALKHENSLGKTEMWYVLDSKDDSKIVYGFNHDMESDQIRNLIDNEKIDEHLNTVKTNKNDVYAIKPGTIHAIGAGNLIAEIQENSNVTYRLYDYNRKDKNGNTRQLHIDKALKVVNLKSSNSPRQPMRLLKYQNGYASELLYRCKYFHCERVLLNTIEKPFHFKTDENSFRALLCIDGNGSLEGDKTEIKYRKGDCIFVPADSIKLYLNGRAQFLNVSC